jgi:hypothetical protein
VLFFRKNIEKNDIFCFNLEVSGRSARLGMYRVFLPSKSRPRRLNTTKKRRKNSVFRGPQKTQLRWPGEVSGRQNPVLAYRVLLGILTPKIDPYKCKSGDLKGKKRGLLVLHRYTLTDLLLRIFHVQTLVWRSAIPVIRNSQKNTCPLPP